MKPLRIPFQLEFYRTMSASTVLLIAFTVIFARLGAAMLMRAGSKGQVFGPVYVNLKVLNASPVSTSPRSIATTTAANADAEIAQELMISIRTLYAEALSDSGEAVDYKALKASEGYAQYLMLAEKLSNVQVMLDLYFISQCCTTPVYGMQCCSCCFLLLQPACTCYMWSVRAVMLLLAPLLATHLLHLA
jgi:hypothetical protein